MAQILRHRYALAAGSSRKKLGRQAATLFTILQNTESAA